MCVYIYINPLIAHMHMYGCMHVYVYMLYELINVVMHIGRQMTLCMHISVCIYAYMYADICMYVHKYTY